MAGLMSGRALPLTHGQWRVEVNSTAVTVTDGSHRHTLPTTEEVRACGFGHHGRIAVVATSADVTLLVLNGDQR